MKNLMYSILTTLLLISCSQQEDPASALSRHYAENHAITLEDALASADAFFDDIQENQDTRANARVLKSVKFLGGDPRTRSSNPLYYLVNYQDGGFALLGADDRLEPIYAISENGSLNLTDTIDNKALAAFINALPKEVPNDPNIIIIDPIDPPTRKIEVIVSPLLSINVRNWTQLQFNDYVRKYCDNSELTPVGCVALSTVQLMSYFKFPSNYSYTNEDNSVENYTMDWTAINNGNNREQVCRILDVLGRPKNYAISYDITGSNGYLRDCTKVLPKFGYSNINQSSFNIEIAKTQIKAYRKPLLIYGGYYDENDLYGNGEPKWKGHAWVIDGLAKYVTAPNLSDEANESFFHFVWGNWTGGDGYYLYSTVKSAFEQTASYKDGTDGGNIGHEYCYIIMFYGFTINK